jgi:hypothetical protein
MTRLTGKFCASLPIGTLFLVTTFMVSASVSERPAVGTNPPCATNSEVLRTFLLAVDRGELKLFEDVLGRDDISPSRVVRDFDIGNRVPMTRVYSDLKEPVFLADHPQFQVNSISVTLSATGYIVETKAHIFPKD